MRTALRRSTPNAASEAHVGQALVEYLLVLSLIALICIPAFIFLRGGIARAFEANAIALDGPRGGTALPSPTTRYPDSEEDCQNERWQRYVTPDGTFKNQGDCQSWVNTNGRNAPALTPSP